MNRFLSVFLTVFLALSLFRCVGEATPKDSTDPVDGRSGLALYIDNLTGCHYLSKPLGTVLTPRVDKNGEHVCHGQEQNSQ